MKECERRFIKTDLSGLKLPSSIVYSRLAFGLLQNWGQRKKSRATANFLFFGSGVPDFEQKRT